MVAGLIFVMPLAQLLLHLLGDQVNGGIKIALAILGKQVGAGHGKPQRAGELPLRHFQMVMFQRNPRAGGVVIQVFQLFNSGQDMIFNRLGESDIVRREDELHAVSSP